ncbi:MAG TPA: hypothetical protein VGC97_05530 [Pyrinomonadaceae bacterium]|jgi:hypothetical protein
MSSQICPKCSLQSSSAMTFCTDCGTSLPAMSTFSPQPAPTVFVSAVPTSPHNPAPPNFSTPRNFSAPKKSNAAKILLAVAGGGFLLLLAVGMVGAGVLYFAVYEDSSETRIYVANSNSKPLADKNSNVAPRNEARTIDDFARSEVGGYKVTNTLSGNPSADGFAGAVEEKQYKYADGGGIFAIHYTIARYTTPADAQQALRDSIANYKKLGIKTTDISDANDNDGQLVGISADMFAKSGLMSRLWTKDEFFIRILGDRKNVDSFFAAH